MAMFVFLTPNVESNKDTWDVVNWEISAAYIILSRKRLDDKEYFDLLGRDLEKFYIHPMKKHS